MMFAYGLFHICVFDVWVWFVLYLCVSYLCMDCFIFVEGLLFCGFDLREG